MGPGTMIQMISSIRHLAQTLNTDSPLDAAMREYCKKSEKNLYDVARLKAAEEKRCKRAERNRRLGGNSNDRRT